MVAELSVVIQAPRQRIDKTQVTIGNGGGGLISVRMRNNRIFIRLHHDIKIFNRAFNERADGFVAAVKAGHVQQARQGIDLRACVCIGVFQPNAVALNQHQIARHASKVRKQPIAGHRGNGKPPIEVVQRSARTNRQLNGYSLAVFPRHGFKLTGWDDGDHVCGPLKLKGN